MSDLPLEAATADVIARYKRGNDMLASAAIALRKLKERIDAGEAGADWDWPAYRRMHLEPHVTKRWINVQLRLAPPGSTEAEVGANIEKHRLHVRDAVTKSRELRNSHPTPSPDPQPGAAVSAEGESSTIPHAPALIATPHDDREGGDSVVSWPDAERLDPFTVEDFITVPDDGLQGHYPRDPVSVFATELTMVMDAIKNLDFAAVAVADVAARWPENIPLLTEDLHESLDWLIEFEAAYRKQHGNGNDAALGTDAAQ